MGGVKMKLMSLGKEGEKRVREKRRRNGKSEREKRKRGGRKEWKGLMDVRGLVEEKK
jgi:hypothetical protein